MTRLQKMKKKTNHFRENQEYYQAQLAADIAYTKQKKHIRKIRLSCVFVVAIVLFVSLFFPYMKQRENVEKAQKDLEQLESDLKALEKEIALKEEQVRRLNDDEYIADLARRDFFMSKDGEVIYSTVKRD